MQRPAVHLKLILPGGKVFGPGKAELLTQIDRLGSISAAGRDMKMSYKRAWGLVEEMNASFSAALVTTERGGADHGGARVTGLGQAVLQHYNRLVGSVQRAGEIDFIAAQLVVADDDLPGAADSVMSGET